MTEPTHQTHLPQGLLSTHAAEVMTQVLAEESAKRVHLVVALSGAHAYGFPSPDSDLDLKAVHIAPTRSLLGLTNVNFHADRMQVISGVEIDYTSNELKPVLLGVIHGNGNYIERFLGKLAIQSTPLLPTLAPLVHAALSRKIAAHYIGFAKNQRDQFTKSATAKKLLYVLRTALTGVHVLNTGEIVTNLADLCVPYGFEEASALIQAKLQGENTQLTPADAEHFLALADRAVEMLHTSVGKSPLPVEPPESAVANLEEWLIEVRRALL
ncbi:MAG: nucleotidyltransferase domain-containing protein [Polyangiaceae bacterium]|nr:nucleotidyltransferase domain-containing protein [Polyangiaceae bacterium]